MFSSRSVTPQPLAAWTDYTPSGPWADGAYVVRNIDGVLFVYDSTLNTLTIVPNVAGSGKNVNNFPIQGLPAPVAGADAANKTYVDAHAGSGGIPEAPNNGIAYGRRSLNWTQVLMSSNDIVDGGNF